MCVCIGVGVGGAAVVVVVVVTGVVMACYVKVMSVLWNVMVCLPITSMCY